MTEKTSEAAHTDSLTIGVGTNPDLMESLGGVKLIEFDPIAKSIALQFECLPRFCHSNGRVAQGGFVTAWLDAAMAHAVLFCNNRQLNVASLDINVRFMRAVGPGTVVARGRIVRQGRRVAFMEAQLYDSSGDCVATATSSGMLVPMSD